MGASDDTPHLTPVRVEDAPKPMNYARSAELMSEEIFLSGVPDWCVEGAMSFHACEQSLRPVTRLD